MNKKNDSTKNRLGLNLFEANLKRHPSVKGLFDKDGNMKSPKDSKNELLLLNIDNKSERESNDTSNNENDEKEKLKELEKEYEKEYDKDDNKEDNKEKRDKMHTMSVQINRVEEKLVDNKDTFFVEMNDDEEKEQRKEIIKKKIGSNKDLNKNSKPLSYGFDDNQKKFDKDITEAMSKGKEYNEIEGKFAGQLKKK